MTRRLSLDGLFSTAPQPGIQVGFLNNPLRCRSLRIFRTDDRAMIDDSVTLVGGVVAIDVGIEAAEAGFDDLSYDAPVPLSLQLLQHVR